MDIKNKIEAILFLAGDIIDITEFQRVLDVSKKDINRILKEMESEKKHTGLNIKIKDNKVQLITNPNYGKVISQFFNKKDKPKKLTKAALETLSIIAYNQPVTKIEVDDIRGVNSDKTISTLQDKNLVFISGQKDTIGTPNIYKVTDDFFKYMNIENLSDLPKYDEVMNEQTKKTRKDK
ncbi:MAG: SMC-Scp complex subunit ScpB [Fusobacteriota bacterium]